MDGWITYRTLYYMSLEHKATGFVMYCSRHASLLLFGIYSTSALKFFFERRQACIEEGDPGDRRAIVVPRHNCWAPNFPRHFHVQSISPLHAARQKVGIHPPLSVRGCRVFGCDSGITDQLRRRCRRRRRHSVRRGCRQRRPGKAQCSG